MRVVTDEYGFTQEIVTDLDYPSFKEYRYLCLFMKAMNGSLSGPVEAQVKSLM
jgi:hypothetical protein